MNKWKLLPHLAAKGILRNGRSYYPFMMAGTFCVFIFFVFSSILDNDLTMTLPHSAYAWMMLLIGQVLLGIILIPFLYYAYSFLIRGRSGEIGLYSILGLEKRHIGIMLVCETLILYILVLAGGVLTGCVFSRLLFLILLRITGLPVEAEFVFTWQAFGETAVFFAVVFAISLISGLIQVGRSRPVELFSGNRKGEREPRWTLLWGLLGIVILGSGYATSIQSTLDSRIFTDFFLAVFQVVLGTYLLFTSGSILLLRILKRNRSFYYRPQNFITVSGMLYRMKKSAAGLSNICIFSTMVIITLVCTVSLYLGIDGITHFATPYDIKARFTQGNPDYEAFKGKVSELEEKYHITALRVDYLEKVSLDCLKEGNILTPPGPESRYADCYGVRLMTLESYERMEQKGKRLEEGQALFYSSGMDFGYDHVVFAGEELHIVEELTEFFAWPRAGKSCLGEGYTLIVKDEAQLERCVEAYAEQKGINAQELVDERAFDVGVFLEGEDELKQDFIEELAVWFQGQKGFVKYWDGLEARVEERVMYGGLLFIGIIFGIIFFVCLLLIMYYKQISEGYEDQGSFAIMQKVGMSDKEIRSTIRRQIFLVFFLPLFGALAHTAAGMFMVEALMGVLNLFNDRLIAGSCAGVALVFALVYGISYAVTARTYYRIVR